MNFLETHFYIVCLMAGVLGLLLGRFFNIVIVRYPLFLENQWRRECQQYLQLPVESPAKFNLFWPRSYCPHCSTPLKWHHTIPVLSYFLLEGRCAYCREKISKLYPSVEILTALSFIVIPIQYGLTWTMIGGLVLTSLLILLFFIDFRKMILPDTLTLSGLWLGLLANAFGLFVLPNQAILGAILGYLVLWIVATLFRKIRKKQGMGHGDFKMLSFIGAWLGPAGMINTLVLAVVFAVIAALIFLGFDSKRRIPFGPYLAIAGWLSLLSGPVLINL